MGSVSIGRRRGFRRVSPAVLVVALLLALGVTVVPVAAVQDESGPLLTVDRLVAERGTPVNVTLNSFLASQRYTLTMRPTAAADGPAIATYPVTTDVGGGGFVTIPTVGLPTGDYVIGIEGPGLPGTFVRTAFGVIDPGTVGPRIVRVYPASSVEYDS